MRKLAFSSLAVGLVLALAIAGFLTLGSSWEARANGDATEAGVDMVTTGNDATTIDTVDSCVEVANDGTFSVDVYVKGIPGDDGLKGFEFDFVFDDTLVEVTAGSITYMTFEKNGSCPDANHFSSPPGASTTSPVYAADSDLNPPATCSETGDGVIARLEMKADATNTGLAEIKLSPTYRFFYTIDYPDGIGFGTWTVGYAAVGVSCPPTSDPAITGQTIGTWDGSTCTLDGGPNPIYVSQDAAVCVVKDLDIISGDDPVDVDITKTITPPADCEINGGGLGVPVVLTATDVTVTGTGVTTHTENFTVHCTQPSAHSVTVYNEIAMSHPLGVDTDENNNDWTSYYAPFVLAIGDLQITDKRVMGYADEATGDPLATAPSPFPPLPVAVVSQNFEVTIETDKLLDDIDPWVAEDVPTWLLKVAMFVPNGAAGEDPATMCGDPPYYTGDGYDNDADGYVDDGCPGSGVPAMGWNQQPGDCQLIDPDPATLPVMAQELLDGDVPETHQEVFTFHCGPNGMGEDDDGDSLIDEDPIDGADNDGDDLVDEDSAFQINTFVIYNLLIPKEEHILDADLETCVIGDPEQWPTTCGNNFKYTAATVMTVRPFNPTFVATIDEASPSDPEATMDDDCVTSLPCKIRSEVNVPGGNPLAGIVTITPGTFTIAKGDTHVYGTQVGQIDFLVWIDDPLGICSGSPSCTMPLEPDNPLVLYNACLPNAIDPDCTDNGVDALFPNDLTGECAGGTASDEWSTNLMSDVVVAAVAADPYNDLWAHYVACEPATGSPINLLVFRHLEPGPVLYWITVSVIDDPAAAPDKTDMCTPYMTDSLMLGTAGDATTIMTCDVPGGANEPFAGAHMQAAKLTRADVGWVTMKYDPTSCAPYETDVAVGLTKDEWVGNGTWEGPGDPPTPLGDLVPVSVPTDFTVQVDVINGEGPASVDVDLAVIAKAPCTADLVPEGGDMTYTPIITGDYYISRLSWTEVDMDAGEDRHPVRKYTLHCAEEGDFLDQDGLQFTANVDPDVFEDPANLDDNQAENVVDITATEDVDGDGIDNADDNCVFDANPDQEDFDGDDIGDVCDPDDDNDGVDDVDDLCQFLAEDDDGVDDADGCPDTDMSIAVDKPENMEVAVSCPKAFDVEITVTNGNYPADAELTLLALSWADECLARWVPEAGDAYAEDIIDNVLHSQLEFTSAGMAFGEVRVLQRNVVIHCLVPVSDDVSDLLQISVLPALPVREENPADNVESNHPSITALPDSDGDSVADVYDNCPGVPNPGQEDADGDGVGDACDNCPNTNNAGQVDSDGDGFGNACDNCPGVPNPNQMDVDGDGVGNLCDNCVTTPNPDQLNSDSQDGGDACDVCPFDPNDDADGDGLCVPDDNCPFDYNPDQADNDGDDIGDVCDPDDDNDGVPDGEDNCPMDANPQQENNDGDSEGDVCDDDDDNDTFPDDVDPCPFEAEDFDGFADDDGCRDEQDAEKLWCLFEPERIDITMEESYQLIEEEKVHLTIDQVQKSVEYQIPLHVQEYFVPLPGFWHCKVPTVTVELQEQGNSAIDQWLKDNLAYWCTVGFFEQDEKVSIAVPTSTIVVAAGGVCYVYLPTAQQKPPPQPDYVIPDCVLDKDLDLEVGFHVDLLPPGHIYPTPFVIGLEISKEMWEYTPRPPQHPYPLEERQPGLHVIEETACVELGLGDDDHPENDCTGCGMVVGIEACDGVDNDGDEDIDEGYPDTDGDGTADCVDPTPDHDVATEALIVFGPAPVQISDSTGRYMWVIGKIVNLRGHLESVTVDLNLPENGWPPAGCTETPELILPGTVDPVFMMAYEHKWVLYRVRYVCHGSDAGVYPFDVELCADHNAHVDGGDDTYPDNDCKDTTRQLFLE